MIKVSGLHKQFGKVKVLDGINIGITDPGIIAILGPNGSGKTTLIKSILGMVIPDKGNIIFEGEPIKHQSGYRNKICYLPQIAQFPNNLTVSELVHFIQDVRKGATKHDELIELFQLQPYLNKKLGHLSGGTRQKVNLLLALMYDAPLLILDEPTTGLDPIALIELKALLAQYVKAGKTIIITSHIMSFVEECANYVLFLLNGNICFDGSVESLKQATGESNLESSIAHLLKVNHDQDI